MPSFAVNAHEKQQNTRSLWVWFEGTTALKEGQGVCYNYDYGTASDVDARRCNRVELPSTTNARYFAGVAARAYSAKSTGQMIEIYGPGSYCKVYAKANCTLGSGILTCEAGGTYAGYFRYAGLQGEGSAVPLQTVNRATTAGTVFAKLQEGEPSGLLDVVDADTGGAITCMVGGTTILSTTGTPAADATFTVADGTIQGMRKRFAVVTDFGDSYEYKITVNGIASDGITFDALSYVEVEDVGDEFTIEWIGDWVIVGHAGTGVAVA